MMVEVAEAGGSANSYGSPAKTRIGWVSKVRGIAGVIVRRASGSLASRYARSCGLRVSTRISSASRVRAIVGVTDKRAEVSSV
jgi:hypothetical protein